MTASDADSVWTVESQGIVAEISPRHDGLSYDVIIKNAPPWTPESYGFRLSKVASRAIVESCVRHDIEEWRKNWRQTGQGWY